MENTGSHPRKRLRRNDVAIIDNHSTTIMLQQSQLKSTNGAAQSQFSSQINLQRNSFAASKNVGTDFHANLATNYLTKSKPVNWQLTSQIQNLRQQNSRKSSFSNTSSRNYNQNSVANTQSIQNSGKPSNNRQSENKKRSYSQMINQSNSNNKGGLGVGDNNHYSSKYWSSYNYNSYNGSTNQYRYNRFCNNKGNNNSSNNGQSGTDSAASVSRNNSNSFSRNGNGNNGIFVKRRRLRRKDQEYENEEQEEVTKPKGTTKRLRKLNRVRENNEDYGQEASFDEREGGSSQDQYDSDFINNDRVEYDEQEDKSVKKDQGGKIEVPKSGKQQPNVKLHSSEEEYYSESQMSVEGKGNEDFDLYDQLTLAPDEAEGGFKHDPLDGLYYLPKGFCLPDETYSNLFPHQKRGITWLYELYRKSVGGVLGDDMGLGKTVQICAYLKGLFYSEQIKKVIIVVPATMKSFWYAELNKWCSTAPNIMQFEDKKKVEREKQIRTMKKKGGILIISYGMVTSERLNLQEMRYDVVVVDEGHKAKNINTELRKNLVALRVKGHKVLLSGTPLQNNLTELWSVFDFVQPKIFGNFNKFQKDYAEPIERSLSKDANQKEKAQDLSLKLRKMYEHHFLRRTKNQIFTLVSAELLGRPLRNNELPIKTDLVVWLPLSEVQQRIYKIILENQTLQQLIEDRKIQNAFFILSYIKKLCQHPYLLVSTSVQKRRQMGLLMSEEKQMLERLEKEEQERNQIMKEQSRIKTRRSMEEAKKKQKKQLQVLEASNKKTKKSMQVEDENKRKIYEDDQKVKESQKLKEIEVHQEQVKVLHQTFGLETIIMDIQEKFNEKDIESMIAYSNKCTFLFKLMKELKKDCHRLLIFSMSKKMLTLIEDILKTEMFKEEYKYLRIDGDTEISSRESICQQFNGDESYFCCLLTTRVGGFGLNLTGANRVVILDPDWNPANDNQAIDRVCRIGQKRDVIVYRLVSSNGIEEKIYRRQIFKRGINLQTIETADTSGIPANGNNTADFLKYFGDSDLFELFAFDYLSDKCETLELLLEKDGFNVHKTPTIDKHIEFLRSLPNIVIGLSINSDLYSKSNEQEEQINNESSVEIRAKPVDQESNSTQEDKLSAFKTTKVQPQPQSHTFNTRAQIVAQNTTKRVYEKSCDMKMIEKQKPIQEEEKEPSKVAHVYKNQRRLAKLVNNHSNLVGGSDSTQKQQFEEKGSSYKSAIMQSLDKYSCNVIDTLTAQFYKR